MSDAVVNYSVLTLLWMRYLFTRAGRCCCADSIGKLQAHERVVH